MLNVLSVFLGAQPERHIFSELLETRPCLHICWCVEICYKMVALTIKVTEILCWDVCVCLHPLHCMLCHHMLFGCWLYDVPTAAVLVGPAAGPAQAASPTGGPPAPLCQQGTAPALPGV